MNDSVVNKLNNLLVCGWFDKLVAQADETFAEISDDNFLEAFKYKGNLYDILERGLINRLDDSNEQKLFDNLIYVIQGTFHNNNYRRRDEIYNSLLKKLNKKEIIKLITKYSVDMSVYYDEKILHDKEAVIAILSKSNFGEEHDKFLISSLKSFFYNDSEELRMAIYDNPQIYDKLARIGNKPNFSSELLREFIYIHGAKYFVSRLHESLKDDEEFMRHIIIENPENIFRGRSNKFKERIKENAFFLFGDRTRTFLNAYGMEYILNRSDLDFIDFSEYLKHGVSIPAFVKNKVKEFTTPKEYEILLLRGLLPKHFYKDVSFYDTKDLSLLLRYNFREYGYPYDDYFIKKLVTKYEGFIEKNANIEDVMRFANNIAASYFYGTESYFEQLLDSNPNFVKLSVDMNVFEKEDIQKLGVDNLRKLAYYPNSLYILSQVVKEDKLDMFVQLVNNRTSFSLAPAIDVNVLLYSTYMYQSAIEDLINKGQLTDENIIKIINITKNNKLLKINNASDIINFEENLSKFCDEQIMLCEDTNYAKEILFAKLLKTNRANAQDFILKYKEGLKEKNSPTFEMLKLLQIIDSITDVDAVKRAYNILKNHSLFDFKSFEEIEKKVKLEISGESFIRKTEIKENESNLDFNRYCMLKGVKGIIPQRGSEFKILAHVVGAYGKSPEAKDVFESWNTAQRDNVSGICTSLITNKHVSVAKIPENAVVFGFKDVRTEEVLMCAPYDIYSRNAKLTPGSMRRQSYIDSEELPDYCRGAAGSYSEVVISRYCEGEKRQPDYIILFDYQKNDELSFAAAKKFNLPLVFINTKQMFDDRVEEHTKMAEEVAKNITAESFVELSKNILSIKHGFAGIPKGHLGDAYAFFEQYEIGKNTVNNFCQMVKDSGREPTKEEIKKVEEYVLSEKKKEKTKHYVEDRDELVKKEQRKVSLQLFNDLRKEYGFREALKIVQIQTFINSTKKDSSESIVSRKPIDGGNNVGTKK